MRYEVTIKEVSTKKVEVDAQSPEEAEDKVSEDFYDGQYPFDAGAEVDIDFVVQEKRPEKIKVVLLEPGKLARVAEIGTKLEDLQAVVDGMIEPAYYFSEPVCLVVNDEGKINGMPLNRGVRDENGKLIDIIAGTAFICDCSGENFGSLNDKQLKRYTDQFKYPEHFFRINSEIQGVKYNPDRSKER